MGLWLVHDGTSFMGGGPQAMFPGAQLEAPEKVAFRPRAAGG